MRLKAHLACSPFLVLYFFAMVYTMSCAQGEKGGDTEGAGLIGKPAYRFEIETLDGQQFSLEDFRGKALILNIWDTKCPPCIREFPGFIELYTTYQPKGLELIGLTRALYENPDGIRRFIKKHKLNYPNAIVNSRLLANLGGTRGIPTTYVIDTNGIIYRRYIGYQDKEVFERDVRAILDISAANPVESLLGVLREHPCRDIGFQGRGPSEEDGGRLWRSLRDGANRKITLL